MQNDRRRLGVDTIDLSSALFSSTFELLLQNRTTLSVSRLQFDSSSRDGWLMVFVSILFSEAVVGIINPERELRQYYEIDKRRAPAGVFIPLRSFPLHEFLALALFARKAVPVHCNRMVQAGIIMGTENSPLDFVRTVDSLGRNRFRSGTLQATLPSPSTRSWLPVRTIL